MIAPEAAHPAARGRSTLVGSPRRVRHLATMSLLLVAGFLAGRAAAAQVTAQALASDEVQRIDLPIGRSYPLTSGVDISRVSIALPEVADVVVIGERELVINAKAAGETDAIVWLADGTRQHYRVAVHSPSDRMQIALYVKFAEVRRDLVRNLGVSGLFRNDHVRVGTDVFRSDNVFDPRTGAITIPATANFGTILTDFDTRHLLAFLQAEAQRGNARTLAEPNVLAANKEEANFLAGGEIPIPVVTGAGGSQNVGIQYKEFGIRLRFIAEVVSDSLVKLTVRPEVSTLDYANAIIISGFRIPALQTRRVESTLDVKRDESLIISGLFNDQREKVKTGVPLLMDLPILGNLFSSTRWQRNETELLVIVTPVVIDPMHPRASDTLQMVPDTTLPARGAIEPRLPRPARPEPPGRPEPPR